MGLSEERGGAETESGKLYRLAWAFYLVLAVVGVLWIGAREGSLGLGVFVDLSRWWIDVGLGVFAGALLIAAWMAAERWLPAVSSLEERLRTVIGPLHRSDALGIALLSGFAEELFFRGALQVALGWPLATLLFALLHSGRERVFWLWTVFAGVAGLVFAFLTLETGNLSAAIVAHCVVNGVNLPRLAGGVDPNEASGSPE